MFTPPIHPPNFIFKGLFDFDYLQGYNNNNNYDQFSYNVVEPQNLTACLHTGVV